MKYCWPGVVFNLKFIELITVVHNKYYYFRNHISLIFVFITHYNHMLLELPILLRHLKIQVGYYYLLLLIYTLRIQQ